MAIDMLLPLVVFALGVLVWLIGDMVRMMTNLGRILIVLTDRVDDLYADDPEPKAPEDKPVDRDAVLIELRSRKAS